MVLEAEGTRAIREGCQDWPEGKVHLLACRLGLSCSPPPTTGQLASELQVGQPAASHAIRRARACLELCDRQAVQAGVHLLLEMMPVNTESLRRALVAARLSNGTIGVEGFAELTRATGCGQLVVRAGLLWPDGDIARPRGMRRVCRSACRRQGVVELGALLKSIDDPALQGLTRRSLRTFLDHEDWAVFIGHGWFWDQSASPSRNKFLNRVEKVAESAGGSVDPADLVTMLQAQASSDRIAALPPEPILLEFLARNSVGAATVRGSRRSTVEQAILEILQRRPGVTRRRLMSLLRPLKIPGETIDYWLKYSPAIARERGLYKPAAGLRATRTFLVADQLTASGLVIRPPDRSGWIGRLTLDDMCGSLLAGLALEADDSISTLGRLWEADGDLYGVAGALAKPAGTQVKLEFDLVSMTASRSRGAAR